MKKILGVVSLFLLSGCSMNFNYSGSNSGYQAAKSAAQEWNQVCHTNIQVDNSSHWYKKSYPIIEMSEFKYDDGTPLNTYAQAITISDKNNQPKALIILAYLSPQDKAVLFKHEFGHFLGINYHTRDGLMAEVIETKPEDQKVSQKECALIK